jgi:FMN phosphatase YigB (HAD superfamily)
MGRVLLLDLGETLIHGTTVLPHVREALEALTDFKADNGKPLQLALVSDTEMPAPPPTAAKIKPIFDQYVETLDALVLRRFFEPVSKHATLSAHAGVLKPDRKVFALAIKRLGMTAKLSECVFVTENAEHVRHCRDVLGMKALQFGRDFTDWSEGPLRLSTLVAPGTVNLEAALRPWAAANELEGVTVVEEDPGVVFAQAQMWVPLRGADLGEAEGVHVLLPVRVDLRADAQGRITPRAGKPSREDLKEAASYVKGLAARGEIGGDSEPLTTHTIETDERGRRHLRRRGFKSATR